MAVTSPRFQFPKSSPSSAFLPSFHLEPWADCKFSFPGRAHGLCKFYPFSLSLCLELNTNNSVGICWLILIVISIRYRIPTNQPLFTSGRESLDRVNYGGKVHMGMETTIPLHDSNCGCSMTSCLTLQKPSCPCHGGLHQNVSQNKSFLKIPWSGILSLWWQKWLIQDSRESLVSMSHILDVEKERNKKIITQHSLPFSFD